MNAAEVGIRVKRQFGDESGVQVTDEDIIRWINDAQHDIGAQQEIIETIATTPSVAGQGTYTIPANIINLQSVYYDNQQLIPYSIEEFQVWTGTYELNGNFSGIPEGFYIYANEIRMYPIPSTDNLDIKMYYSQYPADIVTINDDLTVPVKYHTRIVEYCLVQAYELDENFEAAALKDGQFNEGMAQLGEDTSWTEHSTYPTLTIMPDDV